jgi:hypothetical protein
MDSNPDIMSGRKNNRFYDDGGLDNIDFDKNAFGLEEPSFDYSNNQYL